MGLELGERVQLDTIKYLSYQVYCARFTANSF
jgi:hypothetical protein